jgi:hypothetical protein
MLGSASFVKREAWLGSSVSLWGQASYLASSSRSSFFCLLSLILMIRRAFRRGTDGSNPSPSSGESVSPGNFLFDFYKPAFSAGRSCTLVIGGQCGQSI